MGLINFIKLSPKFLNFLSWPSLSLVYPLCASIWAIESDREFCYEQCLKYWVLFSVISLLEWTMEVLLPWLPFWPYAKGTIFLLLALPYFDGASYIYLRFVKPYLTPPNSCVFDALRKPEKEGDLLINQDGEVRENDQEELQVVSSEGNLRQSFTTVSTANCLARSKREESCGFCLGGISGDKSLRKHLHGKKQNMREENLVSIEVMASETFINSIIMRSNGMNLVESFNKITRANFKRLSGLINPTIRSDIWCMWKKPEFGWTKLNTDGSVDPENAGFGGLLRDCNGDPICAYVSKALTDDIFLVELWAIWRGLVLASGLGIKLLWVESDSLSVVKTINKEQQYGSKASRCLKQIWKLLSKFEKYKVSHSWRESNRAADHLSKMILQGHDVVLRPVDFPDSLCRIIQDDAQGRWYRRGLTTMLH